MATDETPPESTDAALEAASPSTDPGMTGTGPEEPKKPIVVPTFDAADHERWRSGFRGCWVLGCLGGLVVLALVLWTGYYALEQSVWITYQRTTDRLLKAMTFEIDAGRQELTRETVDRFTAHVESLSEPYPSLGRFNKAATGALADGRLSPRELDSILAIMEEEIEAPSKPAR